MENQETLAAPLHWLPEQRRLDTLTPLENNPFGRITQEKRRRLEQKLLALGIFEAATLDTDGVLLTFNKRHNLLMGLGRWAARSRRYSHQSSRWRMPSGEQKQRVMRKRALDEPGYYAFASVVGAQRHFNVLTARLLEAYQLNPLDVLDGMSRPLPRDLEEPGVIEWIIEESACPMTMLRAFVEVGGDEQPDTSPWGWIAGGLTSTTEASLRRWGDSSHLTPQLLRRYCAADAGTPLDVQAAQLSHTAGQQLEPEQFWQFILAHPKGQQTYQAQGYGPRLAEAFRRCAGFRLTFGYASELLRLIRERQTAELEDAPF